MIKVSCVRCRNVFFKSPSKVNPRNYCDMECYRETLIKELRKRGEKFRYKKGHRKNSPELYKRLALLLKNEGHPKWKGEKVSYRGLHQWIRRNKGHGKRCTRCGLQSERPRTIQWANVDGKYRRVLQDYVALCVSCHKSHDLSLKGTL